MLLGQDINLVSQFQDYLVNGTFTDISVSIVQKNLKYSIRCHQSVLASSSKFLENLLKESCEEATLIISDISNDELEQLISFLYTGYVTLSSMAESQRFKALIHQLGIRVPEDDDLSGLMVDDFGQSTVDQSQILYEFQQNAQNVEEVNQILAEIMSDYESEYLFQ